MAGLLVWSPATNSLVPLTPAGAEGSQTELHWFRDDPDRMCAGKPVAGEDTPDYWAKIRALIAYPAKTDGVAWPLEVLVDARDRRTPAAFSMKRQSGRPLTEMVIKAEREVVHKLNWGPAELHEVGILLASLFARLERQGVTQVDNHGENFFLDWSPATKAPRAVSRLDALSFGFHHGGRYWFTEKSKPEFMAPEYHGRDLSKTAVTRESDRFSLGCWMFAIFTSAFPWTYAGGGAARADERVQLKQFAMFSAPTGATVPKAVEEAFSDKDLLPAEIIALLDRALLGAPTQRPAPTEWVAALRGVGAPSATRKRFWPTVGGSTREALANARAFARTYQWAAAGVAAVGLALLLAPRPEPPTATPAAATETEPGAVLQAGSEPAPAGPLPASPGATRKPRNPNAWDDKINAPNGRP